MAVPFSQTIPNWAQWVRGAILAMRMSQKAACEMELERLEASLADVHAVSRQRAYQLCRDIVLNPDTNIHPHTREVCGFFLARHVLSDHRDQLDTLFVETGSRKMTCAYVRLVLGDPDDGDLAYMGQRLAERFPEEAEALALSARIDEKQGKWGNAAKKLDQALKNLALEEDGEAGAAARPAYGRAQGLPAVTGVMTDLFRRARRAWLRGLADDLVAAAARTADPDQAVAQVFATPASFGPFDHFEAVTDYLCDVGAPRLALACLDRFESLFVVADQERVDHRRLRALISCIRHIRHYRYETRAWRHLEFADADGFSTGLTAWLVDSEQVYRDRAVQLLRILYERDGFRCADFESAQELALIVNDRSVVDEGLAALPARHEVLSSMGRWRLDLTEALFASDRFAPGAMISSARPDLRIVDLVSAKDVAAEAWTAAGEAGQDRRVEVTTRIARSGTLSEVNTVLDFEPSYFATFEDACVWNGNSTVVREGREVVAESLNCNLHEYLVPWPDIIHVAGSRATLNVKPLASVWNRGILVSHSRDPNNYAHWLMDILPRIILASETEGLDQVPFVTVSRLTSWQRELLDILEIDSGRFLCVEDLMPARFSQLTVPMVSHEIFPHPAVLRRVRERFENTGLVDSSPRESGRRVFLQRSGLRRLKNEREVERRFEEQGFEMVRPERLGIRGQIELFQDVDAVAGVGGAAFTNQYFMRPGTKVLVVGPYTGYGCYFSYMASVIGTDYRGYAANAWPDHGATGFGWINWRLEVDPDDLAAVTAEFLRT